MRLRGIFVTIALTAALLPAGVQIAGASVSANLLQNGDFEIGTAASDSTSHYPPFGWTIGSGNSAYPTPVTYGAPNGFPSLANGAAIHGGANFLAGGPAQASPTDYYVTVKQQVGLTSFDPFPGDKKLTINSCLGGYASQGDRPEVALELLNASSTSIGNFDGGSATATDRGNVTGFVARSSTIAVPGNAAYALLRLYGVRSGGSSSDYLDAYFDNVSLTIEGINDPAPAPDCGGAAPPPAGALASLGLRTKTAKLSRRGVVKLQVVCAAPAGARCTGKLASTVSGPARFRKLRAARTAAFDLAASATSTLKLKLTGKARTRIAGLSAKRAKQLRLALTVTIGGSATRASLPLKR